MPFFSWPANTSSVALSWAMSERLKIKRHDQADPDAECQREEEPRKR
jgi:hypothetical protein